MSFIIQQNLGVDITIEALFSIKNAPETLTYTAGGGTYFPVLKNDLVLEPGIYHGGNPIAAGSYKTKSCQNLQTSVEKKETLSPETSKGLFDIEYPSSGSATGKVEYFWNDTFTTPLGLYTVTNVDASLVTGWNLKADVDTITLQTNDVNVVPRKDDFIVLNEAPAGYAGYVNGNLNSRLKLFKGSHMIQLKVVDVLILGGTGASVKYSLKVDKSLKLYSASKYAVVLMNRMNTSIQKELFYETFEQVEVHRQQLLGDPYINNNVYGPSTETNSNKPSGRKNFLYYGGHEALGMRNLLKNIINEKETPFVVFDVNDEVKDRFSFYKNTYDADGKPRDTHFEFHLPGVMLDSNVFNYGQPNATPVDSSGNILENIFVASPSYKTETPGVGKYAGLYLKTDTAYARRYGWVFYDLRVVVIDHEELATALGYNSNRNYTLPRALVNPTSGNSLQNPGNGVNLDIVDASNGSIVVIKTSVPHNLKRGSKVVIKDVQGNTAANGEYFVDTTTDAFKFEIWQQMPQYNADGSRSGGISVEGNGIFVNNGVGNSGKVIQALPSYSYFFTYRVRDVHNKSTLPFAETTNFNFARGAEVDNVNGSLFINIPKLHFANGVNGNIGFKLDKETLADFGIDIIIGEYDRDEASKTSPDKIIGIKNVMCIPIHELTTLPSGDVSTGISVIVNRVADYVKAINDTAGLARDYTYDIKNNFKHYDNVIPDTLHTGNGRWTIGEVIYRNHVEINRAQFNVHIPADKWNDSTNPSYRPSQNEFIRNKFISEVAILLEDNIDNPDADKPMIYAKVSPAIEKTNNLDILVSIRVDF